MGVTDDRRTVTVTNRPGRDKEPDARPTREQLKAQTRSRIAAAAMELFAERGFENVSAAQVAALAGVTEKTVFNHFATKEDLAYPAHQDFEDALIDRMRTRPPEESLLNAARHFLQEKYARVRSDGPDRQRATTLARLVAESPALRARERELLNRVSERIAAQIAEESGTRPGDLRPAVIARAIVAIHQGVIGEFRAGLLANEPWTRIQSLVATAADEAFDMLEDGFSELRSRDGLRPRH